jgi:hypothetical protein
MKHQQQKIPPLQMSLSGDAEDLRIMIYYHVSLGLQFLMFPKTEHLYVQGQKAQQSFEALGTIIPTKQRNVSTDLNHDQLLVFGEVNTRRFEEIHLRFGGPHYPRFIKLIFSTKILLNKPVNSYFIVGCHHLTTTF